LGRSAIPRHFPGAFNPHFPALRSGHRLLHRRSPQKQIPSSSDRREKLDLVGAVPVRVNRIRLERVRIDKCGVGAVHGDVHVPRPCVNLDTTLSFGRDSLGRQLHLGSRRVLIPPTGLPKSRYPKRLARRTGRLRSEPLISPPNTSYPATSRPCAEHSSFQRFSFPEAPFPSPPDRPNGCFRSIPRKANS
jgi:hypothetical protein